jgi:glycosyltransferase involved in cell wall biosynthesis
MSSNTSPKVLVLSRNYPNNVTPVLGLWVEGLVRCLSKLCEIKVIAPVPYCPPLPGFPEFTKFRSVERNCNGEGFEVSHPRFLTGPGYSTYNFEAKAYYWSIRRQIDCLRRDFPFDLIHANFGYPDGVVAAKLAARYNIPFIITEHASWIPWMDKYPQARRQAVWAASRCAFHVAVSSFARQTISHFTGETQKLRVVSNGVDVNIFTPRSDGRQPNLNQILYVGYMRHVKGIDVLLAAMPRLVKEKPELKLVLVGGGIYRETKTQELELRELAKRFGIEKNVEFAGIKTPSEVASYMRESALLVLPSRTETFGAVLVEALACGTPVVATACGGPEDIVNDSVGLLVPKEDPETLANAILETLKQRHKFNSMELRNYVLNNFAWQQIAQQTLELYYKAINSKNN